VPVLAAWLRRSTDDVAVAAYLLIASSALTAWLAWVDEGHAHAAFAMASSAAQLALSIGGAAWLLHTFTRRRVSRAAALVTSTSVVVAWLGLDRLHMVTFGEHLSRARLAELHEALRSGAVRFDGGLFVALLAAVVMTATLLRALLAALTYLPQPRWERTAGVGATGIALAALLAVVGTGGDDGALRASLPWGRDATLTTAPTSATADSHSPFGSDAEERMFARLEHDRADILGGPLAARRRPSIVMMHLESTRFDMLREDVMPNTLRLSKSCLSPTHHYSTSNNTGSSMFGLLNGLPVSFYALARRDGAKPLPLQILKKLGYSLSAYYSSYASTYDGLCDLFFKGVVDHVDEERNELADRADAALIDHYVADVARRDSQQPTFDYVVIESSHYDYAYPPTFERFTPTATLGIGRDGVGISQLNVSDEFKGRAPFIRNRYKNSILWTDSLVQRVVDAWATRRDDVILVVTGDHGEAFWEHGTYGHGLSLLDEQVRVPLVMCIPGASATQYTYSSHEDVFATLFDFMGLEGPSAPILAGKSLLRYDPARDLSILGYGLTGSQMDDRLGVAGDGLKVVFVNRTPFETVTVYRDGDIAVTAPFAPEIETRVADLKLYAVDERIIR
jgi:Sulfatase